MCCRPVIVCTALGVAPSRVLYRHCKHCKHAVQPSTFYMTRCLPKNFTEVDSLQTPRGHIKCYCAPKHQRRKRYSVARTCREEPVLGPSYKSDCAPTPSYKCACLLVAPCLGERAGCRVPAAHRTRPQEKQSRPHEGNTNMWNSSSASKTWCRGKIMPILQHPPNPPQTQVPSVMSRALHSPHSHSPGPGQFTEHTRPKREVQSVGLSCTRVQLRPQASQCIGSPDTGCMQRKKLDRAPMSTEVVRKYRP